MIKVTVQTEDRLRAINHMASALEALARALQCSTRVEIRDNVVHVSPESEGKTGISIETVNEVTRTEIVEDTEQ